MPRKSSWLLRSVAWAGSTALHALSAWFLVGLWPMLLLHFCFVGFPTSDHFAFRWDNPYSRAGYSEEDGWEAAVFVTPPRRPQELPEMEMTWSTREWDTRELPYDDALGGPSPFDTPFPGKAQSGYTKAKGESLDYVSDKAHRGKGTYDTLGGGPGGGGRYGSTVRLFDAVQRGLFWLARHQSADGSWSETGAADRCGRSPPCGLGDSRETVRTTALAVLAFDGAGYTPGSKDVWDGIPYKDVLARASRYLARTSRDPVSEPLTLLAQASLVRLPGRFDRPDAVDESVPDRAVLARRLSDLLDEAAPGQGTDAEAWWALAVLAASRGRLEVGDESVGLALKILARRCAGQPLTDPEAWPGKDFEASYLRLLASFEKTPLRTSELECRKALEPRLRSGQSMERGSCREGSWEPAAGEGRLLTTLFQILALETLPGYGSRVGHPLREP